ncbi:MAG: fructokinase [Azospirillum sp.]|nr:fructokinase [Azospirillum sp.]
MARVICLGEVLIDFVATVGGVTLAEAPAFEKAPGGAPANVAVGLARLGIPSAFMGMVGDDPFGHFLAGTLAAAGVEIGALRFTAAARTGLAFVSLRRDGERDFMFYRHPAADMLLAPPDIDEAAIRGAELLHFGTIGLIDEPCRSATRHAVAVARAAGRLVCCDPNLRLDLWPSGAAARAAMLEAIAEADIVKLSDAEAVFLAGSDDPAVVRQRLWRDRHRLLVVTRGPQGCGYLTREQTGTVEGFAVVATDTTGAGDGFVAGLLSGLLDSEGGIDRVLGNPERLRGVCRFANGVGALTTTVRGAIPALPTRDRVRRFLAGQPEDSEETVSEKNPGGGPK